MKQPILLALQLCPIDAIAGWSLLRLISDLCPDRKYEGWDLLVSVRKDTALDMEAIAYAGRRFGRTWTYRCEKLDTGWPAGCNSVASQTVRWTTKQVKSGRWNNSGIFLIEADGLPLQKCWLEKIRMEWEETDKLILGYHDKRSIQEDHINGNCIVSTKINEVLPSFPSGPREMAWDYFWRNEMMEHGKASRFIFNDYKLGSPENPLHNDDQIFSTRLAQSIPGEILQPRYLHGLKDWERGHRLVRERVINSLTAGQV